MIYNEESPRVYAEYVFKRITRANPRKNLRILNAGCGNNWIKRYAPKGVTVVGLDINNPSADIHADMNKKFPIKSGEYDAVILMHIIEHLEQPIHALEECYRVLRPGGVVFISTPSPWSKNAWEDPYHVRPFTTGSIRALASDAKLRTLDAYYSVNTPGFGVLGLSRFERFHFWASMKPRFLTGLNYFRGNAEAVLQKP